MPRACNQFSYFKTWYTPSSAILMKNNDDFKEKIKKKKT